jgi:hypothetical protein
MCPGLNPGNCTSPASANSGDSFIRPGHPQGQRNTIMATSRALSFGEIDRTMETEYSAWRPTVATNQARSIPSAKPIPSSRIASARWFESVRVEVSPRGRIHRTSPSIGAPVIGSRGFIDTPGCNHARRVLCDVPNVGESCKSICEIYFRKQTARSGLLHGSNTFSRRISVRTPRIMYSSSTTNTRGWWGCWP